MVAALRWPLLLVVADLMYVGEETRWLALLSAVSAAAAGQPVAIQVRAKQVERGRWRDLVVRAREATRGDVPVFLNADVETAAALGYDGVHWPEADTPRTHDGFVPFRAAAVHSVAAVRPAQRAGVDFVVFGSVFEPGSKPGAAAGLDALRDVCRAASVPVVAIGGVTPWRVAACLEAGASGVAVVSGVLGAASPATAIETYVDALRGASSDVPAGAQREGGSR